MKGNKLLLAILLLGMLAIAITSYLVYVHYRADITGLCKVNSLFDCNRVNQSEYAMLWEIPLSSWGLLFYTGFFFLSLALFIGLDLRKINWRFKKKYAYWLMFLIPLFGTIFSLRLSFIEAFILKTWCPFCIMQQVIVFLMLILSIILLKQRFK